jgi:hypothetical protein
MVVMLLRESRLEVVLVRRLVGMNLPGVPAPYPQPRAPKTRFGHKEDEMLIALKEHSPAEDAPNAWGGSRWW